MNVVTKILFASLEWSFMLYVIVSPSLIVDPIVWAWYSLCILLAFMLRLGMEHKKNRLTWASLLYQSICTISWCFFMVLVWNYCFTKDTKGFEIYLFVNSLFASFMVSQFEEVFEIGVKEWLRIKLGKFLAVEKGDSTE